jgi:hypothetical protein
LTILVVWYTAAKNNTVLTPAPTDASVKATSTAPISVHSRHIRKLYAPKMTAELIRSRTIMVAKAHITMRVRILRSSCQIT